MSDLLSIGGIIGGAAICLYAFKPQQKEHVNADALKSSPLAMLEAQKKEKLQNKNKLPVIPGKTVVGLETVSKLWQDAEVPLAEAANLWREPEEKDEEITRITRPKFESEEIEAFFVEYVMEKPMVKGARRNVIIHLLKMLDVEGDCPSVVKGGDTEPENDMPQKTFDYLAKISLRKHSLDVARLFASKTKNDAILADILIIALGHDIGKIKRHHKALYTSADHPQISSSLLNGISEFASLPNKADISRAIVGHHLNKTSDTLTALLMKADSESRQNDFSKSYNEHAKILPDLPPDSPSTESTTAPQAAKRLGFKKASKNALGDTNATPSAFAEKEDDRGYRTQPVDLPEWFSSKSLLSAVEPYVNKLQISEDNKKSWVAASSKGIVYLREDAVWGLLESIGGLSDPLFMASSVNENSRRDMVRTIVDALVGEDMIAKDYLPKDGYAVYATVINGQGKSHKSLVIPILTHAFGKLDSDFESLKEATFARFVAKIKVDP